MGFVQDHLCWLCVARWIPLAAGQPRQDQRAQGTCSKRQESENNALWASPSYSCNETCTRTNTHIVHDTVPDLPCGQFTFQTSEMAMYTNMLTFHAQVGPAWSRTFNILRTKQNKTQLTSVARMLTYAWLSSMILLHFDRLASLIECWVCTCKSLLLVYR